MRPRLLVLSLLAIWAAELSATWTCAFQRLVIGAVDKSAPYLKTNGRSFNSVQRIHGLQSFPFAEKGTVLDSGGGFSPVGIRLAKLGYKVIVSDPVDYVGQLKKLATQKRFKLDRHVDLKTYVSSVDGISTDAIHSLCEVLEIPLPKGWGYERNNKELLIPEPVDAASEKEIQSAMQNLLGRISTELDALTQSGAIEYRVGTSQDVLASLPNGQLDGSLDTFGALLYSPDRIALLELLWRKSRVGATHSFTAEGIDDTVLTKSGSKPLVNWLTNYPGFKFAAGNESEGSASRILMTRIDQEFPIPRSLQQRPASPRPSRSFWIGPNVARPLFEYRLR